jgi:hypothetical protein
MFRRLSAAALLLALAACAAPGGAVAPLSDNPADDLCLLQTDDAGFCLEQGMGLDP